MATITELNFYKELAYKELYGFYGVLTNNINEPASKKKSCSIFFFAA